MPPGYTFKEYCPLVSVVIPTYNREKLVARAIKSVLSQTYTHFECIVVDDSSTDKTAEILFELSQSDSRLRIISHQENRHASASRNTGIKASRGSLIAFLDSDDVWLSTKLEKQVNCLHNSLKKVGLVYCWFDIYDGEKYLGGRHPTLSGYVFDKVLLSQPLGNASTLLVRRDVINQIGGFDENLPRGNDGDFIRRISQYYEVEVLPEVLVHYFVNHSGYKRITGNDRESILNGIKGHEAKLRKFSDYLASKPKLHAQLLANIATQYALIGDFHFAKNNLIEALRKEPTSLKVYQSVLRSIINYLKS